jgi:glycosyltransferase involved in cell wall biosynthesis
MAQLDATIRPPLVVASNFQNGDERIFLENLAKQCGVGLTLLGAVTEDRLLRLYNEAMIVAYSPVREPFGLVSLEAMACGTPVVGVNEGGVAESIIDGHTGLLVDRDPRRFAAAISRLITDSELSHRLGSNGRQHVLRQWTWEHAVAALERSLESLVSSSRVASPAPAFAH